MTSHIVTIDYTNWRGERRKREIEPKNIRFGHSDPYHPTNQWILLAKDCEDGKFKDFAIKNIHSWEAQTNANGTA